MEAIFDIILEQMVAQDQAISAGNMMRSPAICYKSKVFAFYFDQAMVFKLDRQAEAIRGEYPGSDFLNPFKNKPPMKGWLVVPSEFQQSWYQLAQQAYENISTQVKK